MSKGLGQQEARKRTNCPEHHIDEGKQGPWQVRRLRPTQQVTDGTVRDRQAAGDFPDSHPEAPGLARPSAAMELRRNVARSSSRSAFSHVCGVMGKAPKLASTGRASSAAYQVSSCRPTRRPRQWPRREGYPWHSSVHGTVARLASTHPTKRRAGHGHGSGERNRRLTSAPGPRL